ncbi:MAG TPA: hypothetical protein VGJ77_20920 [Gaiellaceae bacterium]
MTGAEYEEREVDLAHWRAALVAWWWLPVGGLVLGVLAGAVVSLGGAANYKAQALMTLGQPFSPTGSAPINSFATNPRAVAEIVRSESALKQAASECQGRVGALRGKVSSAQVGTGTGAARTAAPLITVTVQGPKPKKVECEANGLAAIVKGRTTTPYVGTKIRTFNRQLGSIQERLDALAPRITLLERAINDQRRAFDERLLLATQLDSAQERRGQLLDQQTTIQQQLALAENVESARVIQPASAVKSTARSRRNSILVGALIGLILGAIAAIVVDARASGARRS